jgi:hypothetical protein
MSSCHGKHGQGVLQLLHTNDDFFEVKQQSKWIHGRLLWKTDKKEENMGNSEQQCGTPTKLRVYKFKTAHIEEEATNHRYSV